MGIDFRFTPGVVKPEDITFSRKDKGVTVESTPGTRNGYRILVPDDRQAIFTLQYGGETAGKFKLKDRTTEGFEPHAIFERLSEPEFKLIVKEHVLHKDGKPGVPIKVKMRSDGQMMPIGRAYYRRIEGKGE